jgi:phospholipid N-methyltransferase
MPTSNWLKQEFHYGYDSGNILSPIPNLTRWREERRIGGSYRQVFLKAIKPYLKPNSKVLELGSGMGAWSRTILKYIPQGSLHTIDYQDVTKWLNPNQYEGRLICHQVDNNSASCLPENYFDFFWSMGVLCHNNIENIEEILKNTLSKMKVGGVAVHQYSDWEKLEKYGWKRGGVPLEFKHKPDNEIWWVRNNQSIMASLVSRLGWEVISPDLNLVKRDSIIVLKKGG